tara:strand:- start:599 stop:808 length:210 start_codon:yes stop_codon:yes gene_type:complete
MGTIKMSQFLFAILLSLYSYQVDNTPQKTIKPILEYHNIDKVNDLPAAKPCFIWTQQKLDLKSEFDIVS